MFEYEGKEYKDTLAALINIFIATQNELGYATASEPVARIIKEEFPEFFVIKHTEGQIWVTLNEKGIDLAKFIEQTYPGI